MSDELSPDREKAGDLQTEQKNRLTETCRRSDEGTGQICVSHCLIATGWGKGKIQTSYCSKAEKKSMAELKEWKRIDECSCLK